MSVRNDKTQRRFTGLAQRLRQEVKTKHGTSEG
jgi:hypothetical protein